MKDDVSTNSSPVQRVVLGSPGGYLDTARQAVLDRAAGYINAKWYNAWHKRFLYDRALRRYNRLVKI